VKKVAIKLIQKQHPEFRCSESCVSRIISRIQGSLDLENSVVDSYHSVETCETEEMNSTSNTPQISEDSHFQEHLNEFQNSFVQEEGEPIYEEAIEETYDVQYLQTLQKSPQDSSANYIWNVEELEGFLNTDEEERFQSSDFSFDE